MRHDLNSCNWVVGQSVHGDAAIVASEFCLVSVPYSRTGCHFAGTHVTVTTLFCWRANISAEQIRPCNWTCLTNPAPTGLLASRLRRGASEAPLSSLPRRVGSRAAHFHLPTPTFSVRALAALLDQPPSCDVGCWASSRLAPPAASRWCLLSTGARQHRKLFRGYT